MTNMTLIFGCPWLRFKFIDGFLRATNTSVSSIKSGTSTKSAIDYGASFKDISELISDLAWPVLAGLVIYLIFKNIDSVVRLISKAPIIRKFSVAGIEIELDRRELDELKDNTDATFKELIRKTTRELERFRDALPIQAALEAAAAAIVESKFRTAGPPVGADIRCTVHIPDVVFKEFLYQLTDYAVPRPSKAVSGGSGRRFSLRYGIIGLSWRTDTSRGIGNAFLGSSEEVEALIERWSMLDAEVEHGKNHPSCLSVIARDSQFGKSVGILYVDAAQQDVFGDEVAATKFAVKCEILPEVKKLADLLLEFEKMSSQVRVLFDLAQISGK